MRVKQQNRESVTRGRSERRSLSLPLLLQILSLLLNLLPSPSIYVVADMLSFL